MDDLDENLIHRFKILLLRLKTGKTTVEKSRWQFFPTYVVSDNYEILDEGIDDLDWKQYIPLD